MAKITFEVHFDNAVFLRMPVLQNGGSSAVVESVNGSGRNNLPFLS